MSIERKRILYFDIDGVFLSYDDKPKSMLIGDVLQDKLLSIGFDQLVCVSGYSDMVNAEVNRFPKQEQKEIIHHMLKEIFSDKEWFLHRLVLVYETDDRCKHIDLLHDWYYVDDWADQYFPKYHGEKLYIAELGKRILLANPHGNGEDILEWIDNIK